VNIAGFMPYLISLICHKDFPFVLRDMVWQQDNPDYLADWGFGGSELRTELEWTSSVQC
jgi:hypothetical protein